MDTQESVTRLAKPKRKGILGLIFSRFFIIVLLILLELAVLILPIILLQDWLHHYYIALLVFTLIGTELINSPRTLFTSWVLLSRPETTLTKTASSVRL